MRANFYQTKRRASAQPQSPFGIEHKMGFKPIVHYVCGASIDRNMARRAEVKRFVEKHQHCTRSPQDMVTG